MTRMSVGVAREKLADAVDPSRTEPVFLERYGHPAAVPISPDRYEEPIENPEGAEDPLRVEAAALALRRDPYDRYAPAQVVGSSTVR